MNSEMMVQDNTMKSKIHFIRGLQVMLDEDLAECYKVKIKRLNEQVKRNMERFPLEFMFQLTEEEKSSLRSQIATLNKGRGSHRKYLPYAFTEQGVAMLSSVLKSETAIQVSIQIMRAFVTMRKFLASNAQIFQRLDTVEKKQIEHDGKFEQIFDALQSNDLPKEKGIFFDGQVFDAYTFVADIIRSAQSSIVLIDNYVDDTVLTLLNKRNKGVSATIFTSEISEQLRLDLAKYHKQYSPIELREFKQSHDRFIILDKKKVYHFGASLKDLGKKWFAFSTFDKESFHLVERLGLR